jgi:hypothetical protein
MDPRRSEVTTNQLVALSFPLVTAAAVGLTALFIRRPWAEQRETYVEIAPHDFVDADDVFADPPKARSPARQELEQRYREVIDAAERLIQSRETFRNRARLAAEPAERAKTPHT